MNAFYVLKHKKHSFYKKYLEIPIIYNIFAPDFNKYKNNE